MINYYLKSVGIKLILFGILLGFFEFLMENYLVILVIGIIFFIISKFMNK